MSTMSKCILSAALISLAACGTDDTGTTGDTVMFQQTFYGLEDLGAEYVYEGWLIVDGAPVSTGRFDIGDDGVSSVDVFEVSAADAEAASAFVLTIEPAQGDVPEPSSVHVLAGDLDGSTADLSVDHAAALATDFSNASGSFILKTPTSASDTDDNLGIWWLDPTAGPAATLNLPTLPEGWVYEGWVVGTDGPVSTGRFSAGDVADHDGVGPEAGTDGCTLSDSCPPFPGQDFISPALDLVGLAAVISVEPEPDNSPAPFALKPLIDASIEDIAAPATQSMENMSSNNNPTGSVLRQ